MANYRNDLTAYTDIMIEANIYNDDELKTFERVMTYRNEDFHIGLVKFSDGDAEYYSLRPIVSDETYNENFTIVADDLPCLDYKSVKKRRQMLIDLITEDYFQSCYVPF